MNIKYKMHGLWIVPAYCLITERLVFMRISHTAFIQNRKTTYWKQQSLQSLFCLEDLFFVFFSRKILFYSASITVIFQIIITALELVMPDLLGALGIVLFLYPIGWYRIIIRLLVRIGSGGVLSYFLASLCPYLFIFFGKQTSD